MQPGDEKWGDQRDKKLPMEPTRAPWARQGPNHLDVRPPRLSASSQGAAHTAAPGAVPHRFHNGIAPAVSSPEGLEEEHGPPSLWHLSGAEALGEELSLHLQDERSSLQALQ